MSSYYKRIVDFCTLKREAERTNHNIATIEQSEAAPRGFIQKMLTGTQGGVVLKNAFSPSKLAVLKNFHYTSLTKHAQNNGEEPYVTFPFNYSYQSYVKPQVGIDYFENLLDQRNYVNTNLGFNLLEELRLKLKRIDPSWDIEPKQSPFSGLGFAPFTFRGITNKNQLAMGAHLENGIVEHLTWMNTQLESPFKAPVLSMVVMLENQKGGRLILFNRVKNSSIPVNFNDKTYIDLEEGDLLLFHGGETYHAVEPIQGDGTRQTLGSFINVVPETKTLEFWI